MNYKNFTKIEIIMLKLIILLRRDLMGWKFITVLAYFLKLYGLFLISNCILIEIDNLEVSNYIKILTLFGSQLSITNFFIKYYNILFFIIISIAFGYIAALTYYLRSAEVSVFDPPGKNEKRLTKGIIVLEKFISYTTFGLMLLSQHLIEFLSLSIVTKLNTLPTATITDPQVALVQTQIASFTNSLLINPIIYLGLAVVVITMINIIIFFYFYYLNESLLNYDSILKYTKLKHYPIVVALMTNFQGVVLYDIVLYQSSVATFHLILTCFILFFAMMFLIRHYRVLTYFNAMKMSTIFTKSYSVIACLVNVVYKYTLKTPGVNLSATNLLFMLLNQAVIAFVATKLLAYYKSRTYFDKLSKQLFKKDKRIKNEILLFLGEVMKNSMTNPKELLKLASIFSQHSVQCKIEDCDCKKMDLDKLYSNVNKLSKETNQVYMTRSLQLKIFSKKFSELISFIECVIVNSISRIQVDEIANDSLILLHVDYVSYFKRSYLHANYLIAAYGNVSKLKMNFNDKVKFFLLKNNNFERYTKEVMHDNILIRFYNHFKKIKKMKKLIERNCIDINEVISMRKSFKTSEVFTKSDRILELSHEMKKNDKRLMKMITDYPECLRNSQFCFIINNYFTMTFSTKIPKKLLDMFSFYNTTKFNAEYITNQDYSFPEMKMMYPIIVSIKDKENFQIKYACYDILEKLNYKKEDMIGHDINIFLPGIMARPHKIILKNKILIQKLYEIKKKTFILSHDNYYMPVEFYSSFFTNFNGEIEIIINIQLKENKEKKYNKYFFLIDDQFNIISHSKNFEENYYISRSLIQKTNLTIISMLNLSDEKILKRFQSNIDLISSVNMNNSENFVSVLHSVDFTNDKSDLKRKFGTQKICMKIHKTKLIPTLEKIKQCLEEYDSEKKVEMDKLNEMILEFGIIKRSMSSAGGITEYLRAESIKKTFRTDDEFEEGNNFLFELELKQMGDLHFYYGKLYENKSSYSVYNAIANRRPINESVETVRQIPTKDQNMTKATEKNLTIPSLFGNNLSEWEMNYDDKTDNKNSFTALFSSSANLTSELNKEKRNLRKSNLKYGSTLNKNKSTENLQKDSAKLRKSFFSRLNQKFVFSTLIVLLLFHVGFFLYVFGYSNYILTESENIFFVNFYALALKSVTYFTSSAVLCSCLIADIKSKKLSFPEYPLTFSLIRTKLQTRLAEIVTDYRGINSYLSKLGTGADGIYEILNRREDYDLLYNDWSQYSRQSSLGYEVIYLRDYIYPLQIGTTINYCSLAPFYQEKFYANRTVTSDEFVLHYFIKNVFTNFNINLENISSLSTKMIIANQIQIKSYFSMTNVILLLLSILMLIFIFMIIKILESNLKESIQKLLIIDMKKFDILNKNLEKFTKFLKDVNKENLEYFEKAKNDDMQVEDHVFDPTDANSSISKKQDKQTDTEHIVINVEDLFIVKTSKIILLLGFIFYIGVTLAQLFLRSAQLDNIVYANKISISILERFSLVLELDLFFKLAVIQNNPYFVNSTQAEYDALSVSGIYDKFNPDANELYQEAKDSYFSFVYFKTTQVLQNIDDYMLNYKSSNFLNNTKNQEEMLAKSDFCVTVSMFFYEYYFACASPAQCATLSKTSIIQCDIPINSEGFKPGLTATLTNLKNYFLDYLKLWKTNPSQNEVNKFIYNHEILTGTMNIEQTYKHIHSNIMLTINQDMIVLYDQSRFIESLFTVVQICFDFCFLTFIIFVIFLKLHKYSNKLKKFYDQIEKQFKSMNNK